MPDRRDIAILNLLQQDSDMPVATIAEQVNLSPSACSRRIADLRRNGTITGSMALLDRRKIGLPMTIFVIIRARHSADWLARFRQTLASIPEVLECHRLTGQADYIVKLAVPGIEHYDHVYKKLIDSVEINDVSAHISMEVIKDSRVLPLDYIDRTEG